MQVAAYYDRLNEAHKLLCQVTGELSLSLTQRKITKRSVDQCKEKIRIALELINHKENSV